VVDGRNFTAQDMNVLEGLAGLASFALVRLWMRSNDEARERLHNDLAAAQRVQRKFLPDALPPESGMRVEAKYLPAYTVGGDFYDLVYHGDGRIGAAIGDVCGKGVAAALLMSRVSSELRRLTTRDAQPSKVLADANKLLDSGAQDESFVTASSLQIDARRRKLHVASAGHVPLIVKRANGTVSTFGAPSGTPLGMLPCEYTDETVTLHTHDIVILMTDGLVEALDRPSDRLGMDLLLNLIKAAPHDPKQMNERILTVVDKMKGQKRLDDITLVALQLMR
jgi:serine phosphatase RsbU (regulator of sigma subunit)